MPQHRELTDIDVATKPGCRYLRSLERRLSSSDLSDRFDLWLRLLSIVINNNVNLKLTY